jgi:hypothetical protein
MPRGPRHILDERLPQISDELESLFENSLASARRELAEELNQGVRRLRIAPDEEELCATLSGAAARFAGGVELFRIAGDVATNERIELPLVSAPALAASIESRDPLIAAATAGEVSAALVALFEHAPGSRVALFPLEVRDQVPGLIYCWGTVQVAAVELLAQVASAVWSALPVPAPQLVAIAPAPVVELAPPRSASTWDEMDAREREMHLRAQRFARVQASEMRLYNAALVQNGRTHRNIYDCCGSRSIRRAKPFARVSLPIAPAW